MNTQIISTTNGGSYTKLTAADGCYLTQAADIDITLRVLAQEICLSQTQTADDWTEIDSDQYAAYKAAQEEATLLAEQEQEQETDSIETDVTEDTDEGDA